MSSIKKTDHYYLIDGSGYIFRAYYALPPLSRKSDGLPTGAVSGFSSMLFKLLEDSRSDDSIHKPTHFAVIFDSARKNFRNDIYSEYKANRAEAPDDLIPQFEYIRKSVKAFNLPSIELLNYEADDLIATYAKQITDAGAKVTVISSDKDLMQLVSDRIRLYDPMKSKVIGEKEVLEFLSEKRTGEERKEYSNRYLSEDYMFCQWARKIGLKIWLCPWMQLQHVGSYVFGGSLADLASIGASATADESKLKKKKVAMPPK